MNAQVESLLNEAVQLSYFMRGGASYETILESTRVERNLMGDFLKKHLEKESKKLHPNY